MLEGMAEFRGMVEMEDRVAEKNNIDILYIGTLMMIIMPL